MKRKYVYLLLALPFTVFAVYLLLLPSETRATFFYELKHAAASMLGYDPAPILGEDGKELGLRSESPEEYGPTDEVDADGDEVDADGNGVDESESPEETDSSEEAAPP